MRILDTDHCIDILRGREEVILKRRGIYDEVATTIITACELYYGAAKSTKPLENKRAVDAFLKTLRVLGMDQHAAQFFGLFKAELEKMGRCLADADMMIGSIARAHNAIVITGNTRHFERIPGLTLENWR
ncbi:type II toxin-antitoxin system VapC family toxin [Prosthecobacter algae]|uniref:Type II toxin-antitoxin system VapC family toxin n=1 Tax=Prosthecobacter algae TaxID=1144682 RepID=A0ABP9PAH1_9BACT